MVLLLLLLCCCCCCCFIGFAVAAFVGFACCCWCCCCLDDFAIAVVVGFAWMSLLRLLLLLLSLFVISSAVAPVLFVAVAVFFACLLL